MIILNYLEIKVFTLLVLMAPTLYEWDITQNRFVESKDASEPYDELCQRLNCNNCLIGLCFRKSAKLALLMNRFVKYILKLCSVLVFEILEMHLLG